MRQSLRASGALAGNSGAWQRSVASSSLAIGSQRRFRRQIPEKEKGKRCETVDPNQRRCYAGPMMNEFDRRLDTLEAKMKVLEANLSSTLDSFRADMAKRDTEAVKRDLGTRMWLLTAIAAAVGILAALIGILAALNLPS